MKTFDTVAKLKLAKLKAGQFIETGGYYVKGDAGAARYLIVTPQSFDGYGDHELANGNIAVLQVDGSAHPELYGAKGDGTTLDTPSLISMYTSGKTKVFTHPHGRIYMHDGSSIIIPEGVNIIGNNSEYKLQGGSYTSNRFFLKNTDNINYDAGLSRQKVFNIVGLGINGNESNVVMTSASTCALWFCQADNVQVDNLNIYNLAGDNGSLAGITFRFCDNFQVSNCTINNTDRQGVQCWESRGEVKGGFIGVSKYREPILASSENVPSYQGSNCEVSHVKVGNTGTISGTHVVRFSGKSSGAVKHCDIQGSAGLDGIYVTFGLEHNILIEDNDIRDCEVGVKVDTTGTKRITLRGNRYRDCEDGISCIASGADSSIELDGEKLYDTTDRPLNLDYMPYVNVRNCFIRGGANNNFINNYDVLDFTNNTITGMTHASLVLNIGARTGSTLASINRNKVYSNTVNNFTTSENVFATDNTLNNFIGNGIKLQRLGRLYLWEDTLSPSVLYVKTSEPATLTDGTVVGTQT